jgi:hypothetical protein
MLRIWWGIPTSDLQRSGPEAGALPPSNPTKARRDFRSRDCGLDKGHGAQGFAHAQRRKVGTMEISLRSAVEVRVGEKNKRCNAGMMRISASRQDAMYGAVVHDLVGGGAQTTEQK